jgi:diguanylate cyclase (GGDEF)-like protein
MIEIDISRVAMILITGLLIGLGGISVRNISRGAQGLAPFVAVTIAAAIYTTGMFAEYFQTTASGFFNCAKVEYLGLCVLPFFWIWFVFTYTGRDRFLTPVLALFLSLLSLGMLILVWTNDYHHAYYAAIVPEPGQMGKAYFVKGPLYPLVMVYFYASFATGLLSLAGSECSLSLYRKQGVIVILASLFPIVFSLLYVVDVRPLGLDLTPYGVILSCLTLAYGIFQKQAFNIVPIARQRVLESMNEGVIVLDGTDRIADYNAAAERLIPDLTNLKLGQSRQELGGTLRDIVDRSRSESSGSFRAERPQGARTLRFAVTRIESVGRKQGSVILVTDETESAILLEKLVELATHDPLTGLINRRRFAEIASAEYERACRHGQEISFLILDIDLFKSVNDRFGHAAGDAVLAKVARAMQSALRECDSLARYGGEEFIAILPETPLEGALVVAERIRATIEGLRLSIAPASVTASLGVSSISCDRPRHDEARPAYEAALVAADAALYRAKEGGRNSVETATQVDYPVS